MYKTVHNCHMLRTFVYQESHESQLYGCFCSRNCIFSVRQVIRTSELQITATFYYLTCWTSENWNAAAPRPSRASRWSPAGGAPNHHFSIRPWRSRPRAFTIASVHRSISTDYRTHRSVLSLLSFSALTRGAILSHHRPTHPAPPASGLRSPAHPAPLRLRTPARRISRAFVLFSV